MTKPSAPAQEWVCVPLRVDHNTDAYRAACDAYAPGHLPRAIEAYLAAAPDSGMVAVPRELLERIAAFIVSHARPGPVDPLVLGELRALLSRAGNKGDGR